EEESSTSRQLGDHGEDKDVEEVLRSTVANWDDIVEEKGDGKEQRETGEESGILERVTKRKRRAPRPPEESYPRMWSGNS
ncbi:unnamed protein product, partial [Lampetra fluviatilis]